MTLTRRQFLARAGGMAAAAPLAAWAAGNERATLVRPAQLAARLKRGNGPAIFQVGFDVLFRAAHIPGAEYAGPASRAEGLATLRQALQKLPRDRAVVLYCGCCPWVKCPNIHPAAAEARRLGMRHVELLYLRTSFAQDWVRAGFPTAGRDIQQKA